MTFSAATVPVGDQPTAIALSGGGNRQVINYVCTKPGSTKLALLT